MLKGMFKGVAASPGIEIAKVFVLKEQKIIIEKKPITGKDVDNEIQIFNEALELSREQLTDIQLKAHKKLGMDQAGIFDALLMVIEDRVLLDEVRNKIKNDLCSAEYALSQVMDKYITTIGGLEDEYLRERASDIRDIGERITKNILGVEIQSFNDFSEPVIVIAKNLTPADTVMINREMIKGLATDIGGKTSHTAILARSMAIPAVVGLMEISKNVKNDDLAIIDGNNGVVYLNPDDGTLQEYQKLRQEYLSYQQELNSEKNKPCETKCKSRRVEIVANIGAPGDCKTVLASGAEGIGLYRTEFLYMDRSDLPNEDEQFMAYKAVAEAMNPGPVIIRTLDIGGDKKLPYLEMPDEMNPFLGWRAVRLCLDRTDIFKTQLKAILRASHYGNLRIMYPMISNIQEVRRANELLAEAMAELNKEGIPFQNNLPVGIMIEIPSAAIIADKLAKEVDFFSIGTNDLIQYTLAVDRMNEHISYLYEPLHPAVLRLIKNIIDASHQAGIQTGMCGEMAGDLTAVPILLGMGLDEFSMSSVSIPYVKKVIRSLTYEQAQEIAKLALNMEIPEDIKQMVKKYTG
jgi:phosphoenolpyruvate-protein phosphotransferase (PTS system enzyme I)